MVIPAQPFGFVAGRWVLSLADTPLDADRAPDYKPLFPGSVIFNNKLSHRVVTDGSGTVGIVKTRIEARLNEDGKLVDAEYNEFIALPLGVYSVTFSFGQYSWPSFDIEVKPEHTIASPLWLPSKSPIPAGPGIVHVVTEEARIAAEAAAASAWAAVDTPGRQGEKGDRGPVGHLGFMSDTPRIVNLALGREHETSIYGSQYKSGPLAITEGDIIYTHRVYSNSQGPNHGVTGSIAILDPSRHTNLATPWRAHASADRFIKSSRVEITSPVSETASIYFYGENPGTPVLFSDVNIINLTQAYGAGNEPSLEYMDALVEKHGGYIDDEQYVVGDALHSQTLAGQGMTLRHDNSVGERVLLDHPGGSVMLHGDTGRRDIFTLTTTDRWVTPTGADQLVLSRIGNTVYLEGRLERAIATAGRPTGAEILFTAPQGFRPHRYSIRGIANVSTNIGVVSTITSSSRIEIAYIPEQWVVGDIVNVSASWRTIDPWPDTLPGTPL